MGWIDAVVHAIQLGLCVAAAEIDEVCIKTLKHECRWAISCDPRLENQCRSSSNVAQVSVGWIDALRKI